MIEFAFVMPILVIFLLGVVYFAMAFNLQMVLNGAVREGTRAWASSRGNTSPCLPADIEKCDPTGQETGFNKNVAPLVKKYIEDNGYNAQQNIVFEEVQLFPQEVAEAQWSAISDSAADPIKVKLTITYFYRLPGTNFSFTEIPITASCTMKRGT